MSGLDQLTAPEAELGEAPVWLPDHGGLCWVDQAAGDALRLTGSGEVERWHVGPRVAIVRARRDGGLILALDRGFGQADAWGALVSTGPQLWPDADVWFNDGTCDPDGTLWCGTAPADFSGTRCALYRHAPDGTTDRVLDGVGISNGLAWSPDGSRTYYVDTLTRRIDVFDGRPSAASPRRPFATIEDGVGYPDGLCVDADGRVWVALWDGGAVRCYEPDGSLAEVIAVPVRQVTACTFGGPDLADLYITTKREGHRPDEAATAGSVFRARPGAVGLPAAPFAG